MRKRQCDWEGVEGWNLLDMEYHFEGTFKVWWCGSLKAWDKDLQCIRGI